ncbi:transposase [Chryseobacterium sp. PBS4-4]|uniref:Transposase n=1 Tax=Chryseobacterium edaphi TaxID=2976532 RepID=A0ABT2W951_9FLAO|nr:transposase [Chryseobacterium edaphi]MCU7617944.1 transposase [Chryseobacterium edaphi]
MKEKYIVDKSLKDIHIGHYIHLKVIENKIDINRICNFFDLREEDIIKFYESEDIATSDLLRWCKLLNYDFFRIYTGHLILYSPPCKNPNMPPSELPAFKKNIYTQEVIDYLLELITKQKKSIPEVLER